MATAQSPASSSSAEESPSLSTVSLIARNVHRQQVEMVYLRSQLAQLQARVDAQETRITWIERFVQQVMRCFSQIR